MTTFENLDGEKLFAVFNDLVEQQILIKVYLPKVGYENLTIVTKAVSKSRQQLFQIDVPKGLHAAMNESGTNQLLFEFTSDDKVIHRFKSEIATIGKKTISMRYPLIIQRHQQRDNFRIKVSVDSFANAWPENTMVRMEIDNISLGGMYCYCPKKFKAIMSQGLELTDMELTFTLSSQCACVTVRKATIKRVERLDRPRRFGIAMEFNKPNRDNKKLLVYLIYDLQRLYLQNRTRKG